MTEFVRVRRGGGLQILSGRLFISCIASATNPKYFEGHFFKPKQTNIEGKGGRRRGTASWMFHDFHMLVCVIFNILFICYLF